MLNLFKPNKVQNLHDDLWAEVFSDLEARAEKDLDTKLTFVDPRGILQDIKGKTNSQLTGRRGTGKTSILLKLYQENYALFKKGLMYKGKQEFLPIYISVGALQKIAPFEQQTNSMESTSDPELRAANNYRRFLHALLVGTHSEMPGLIHYVESEKMGPLTKRKARKKLLALETYLKQGEDQIQSIEKEYSEIRKNEVGIGIKSSTKINPITPTAEVVATSLLRAVIEQTQGGRVLAKAKLVLSEVSTKILDVVKALRCKKLLILVDEWSSGQNPTESQTFFFELLKHSFISQPSIIIKMAVVPENYKEYDLVSQTGLEPGGAYFTPMDLDDLRPYGDNYLKVSSVMTEILDAHLLARLLQKIKRLPKFLKGKSITEFLFMKDSLQEAIIASEGNIRDFILICSKIHSLFRKEKKSIKFEQSIVRKGIGEYFRLHKWSKVQKEEIRKAFINICQQVYSNNLTREIRIRDTTNTNTIDILTGLREARLLHPSRDPLMIEGKWYKFFIVDYSGYLFIQTEYPHKFIPNSNNLSPDLKAHPDKILEITTHNLM